MWLASMLLVAQGFLLFLDFTMSTWIFDEVGGFAINGALVWIVAKQRKIIKGKS